MLSFAGDQFAQVAIAILVYRRTHSALLTALAYALTYLPPIAGGPLLSGLADLFPRRRVMIACDVLRIGTVGLMAIPGMPFAALCALLFCTVLASAPLRIVFGNRKLLILLLFGWPAGFYIVPEGLAAPYVHALHGSTVTAGLLMTAMPAGMAVGAFPLSRIALRQRGCG